MVQRATATTKVVYGFIFVAMLFRFFTGAPEAQTNFMGLITQGASWTQITDKVESGSLGVYGPTLEVQRSATSTPPKSAEYKLYKKYVQPDKNFHVDDYVFFKVKQLIVSIQSTSYYIKDLTLRSLHSNSPPNPVLPIFVSALIGLFIVRIGVIGIYGETKNYGDWGLSLQ